MFLFVSRLDVHFGFAQPFCFCEPGWVRRNKFVQPCIIQKISEEQLVLKRNSSLFDVFVFFWFWFFFTVHLFIYFFHFSFHGFLFENVSAFLVSSLQNITSNIFFVSLNNDHKNLQPVNSLLSTALNRETLLY